MNFELTVKEDQSLNDNSLKLCQIKVSEEYAEKWNVNCKDFYVLVKNGKLIRETLYRKGASDGLQEGGKYYKLIQYKEAYYPKEILEKSDNKDPKHLEGRWCILDKDGNELVIQDGLLDYIYIVSNSCIYTVGQKYYNIETKEYYGKSNNTMESKEFLFLDLKYDFDIPKEERGVLKINKNDGTSELFL